MKAYKGFNKDLTCRGLQYEEGKTYEEQEAKLCESGFHACENPIDCFSYYAPANSEYHEVELEDVSPKREGDSKVVAKKITIGAKINLFNIVQASVEYIKSKVDWTNNKNTNTGNCSAATNTGNRSAATNTGYCSAAEVSGKESIAIVTGKGSKARGALGNWLVLTERDEDWHILGVQAVKVDGEKVKADTWYRLVNGELTECE